MRKSVACMLLLVLAVGCTQSGDLTLLQEGSDSSVAKTEVRQVLESYYSAFSDRDWPRFEDHFWPGATITTIWAPAGELAERVVATSIPDFVAHAPEGPGSMEIFEERMLSAQIRVEGGLAQAWARYHARFGDPGEVTEWGGVDAFTLLRFEGQWKIATLVFMPDSE